MKINIYYIITILILSSCAADIADRNNTDEIIDSLIVNQEYFPNGELSLSEEYNSISGNGWCIEYYSNGNIKRKGKYKKFKPFGFWSYFSETGILEFKKETICLDTNEQYLNQIIFYHKNGEINTNKSSFYSVEVDKREISLGDSLKISIGIGNSINNYGMEVRLGKLTESNQWEDPSSVDTIYFGKYDITIPLIKIANRLGYQTIDGQVVDYKVSEIDSKFLVKERVMYFSVEYFVKQ